MGGRLAVCSRCRARYHLPCCSPPRWRLHKAADPWLCDACSMDGRAVHQSAAHGVARRARPLPASAVGGGHGRRPGRSAAAAAAVGGDAAPAGRPTTAVRARTAKAKVISFCLPRTAVAAAQPAGNHPRVGSSGSGSGAAPVPAPAPAPAPAPVSLVRPHSRPQVVLGTATVCAPADAACTTEAGGNAGSGRRRGRGRVQSSASSGRCDDSDGSASTDTAFQALASWDATPEPTATGTGSARDAAHSVLSLGGLSLASFSQRITPLWLDHGGDILGIADSPPSPSRRQSDCHGLANAGVSRTTASADREDVPGSPHAAVSAATASSREEWHAAAALTTTSGGGGGAGAGTSTVSTVSASAARGSSAELEARRGPVPYSSPPPLSPPPLSTHGRAARALRLADAPARTSQKKRRSGAVRAARRRQLAQQPGQPPATVRHLLFNTPEGIGGDDGDGNGNDDGNGGGDGGGVTMPGGLVACPTPVRAATHVYTTGAAGSPAPSATTASVPTRGVATAAWHAAGDRRHGCGAASVAVTPQSSPTACRGAVVPPAPRRSCHQAFFDAVRSHAASDGAFHVSPCVGRDNASPPRPRVTVAQLRSLPLHSQSTTLPPPPASSSFAPSSSRASHGASALAAMASIGAPRSLSASMADAASAAAAAAAVASMAVSRPGPAGAPLRMATQRKRRRGSDVPPAGCSGSSGSRSSGTATTHSPRCPDSPSPSKRARGAAPCQQEHRGRAVRGTRVTTDVRTAGGVSLPVTVRTCTGKVTIVSLGRLVTTPGMQDVWWSNGKVCWHAKSSGGGGGGCGCVGCDVCDAVFLGLSLLSPVSIPAPLPAGVPSLPLPLGQTLCHDHLQRGWRTAV